MSDDQRNPESPSPRPAPGQPGEGVGDQSSSEPLGYASPQTPFLRDPFPSPRLTAWVTLIFTLSMGLLAVAAVGWVVNAVVNSDEPIGTFACVIIPVVMVLIVMVGLSIETVRSFRRARNSAH